MDLEQLQATLVKKTSLADKRRRLSSAFQLKEASKNDTDEIQSPADFRNQLLNIGTSLVRQVNSKQRQFEVERQKKLQMEAADMEVLYSINNLYIVVMGQPEIDYSISFEMQGLQSRVKIENDWQDYTLDFSVNSIQIRDGDHLQQDDTSCHHKHNHLTLINKIMSSPLGDIDQLSDVSSKDKEEISVSEEDQNSRSEAAEEMQREDTEKELYVRAIT